MKPIIQQAGLTIHKDAGTEIICVCPDCGGQKLSVNKKTGQWKCFRGCNNGNAYTMLRDFTNMKHADIIQVLRDNGMAGDYDQKKAYVNDPAKKPRLAPNDIEKLDGGHIERLANAKRVGSVECLGAWKIKGEDIAIIPGFDPEKPAKACGWIRVHLDGKMIKLGDSLQKYPVVAGSQPGLVGYKTMNNEGPLIFCEGWKDMLAARSQGYASLTNTQGVSTWRESWGQAFKGREVLIVFDRDKAGERAEKKIAKHIAKHALSVAIGRLPYEFQETNGKDLHDYVVEDDKKIGDIPFEKYVAEDDGESVLLDNDMPKTVAIAFEEWSAKHCNVKHKYNHVDGWSIYKDDRYQQVEDEEILGYIRQFIGLCSVEKTAKKKMIVVPLDKQGDTFVKNVLKWLKTPKILSVHLQPKQCAPCCLNKSMDPDNTIAMNNGLLDITDRMNPVLRPFNELFYTFNYLPFDYDPDRECPTIDASLGCYFRDENGNADTLAPPILHQMLKRIVTRDTSAQKIFALIGPRRSGKSTIGRLINKMVGAQNVASMTISSLAGSFGLQPLLNKSLGILWDASVSGSGAQVGAAVDALKGISGEDQVTVNRKNLPQLPDQLLKMNILMIANNMVDLKDPSGALAGRFNFLRTTHSFYGHEDPSIEIKMQDELPGLFNKALRAAEGALMEHPNGVLLQNEFLEASSPYHAFANTWCVLNPKAVVPKEVLWMYYCEFCEQNNVKPVSPQKFKINFTGIGDVQTYRPAWSDPDLQAMNLDHNLDQTSIILTKRTQCYRGIDIGDLRRGVWSQHSDKGGSMF
jgi:P4 family phage/plasmid primase-like protien